MSFFEDLALALDSHNIEPRIVGECMHVSVLPTVDLRVLIVNDILPAAKIFVEPSGSDVAVDERQLLAVSFSVQAAVDEISMYMETAQGLRLLEELCDDPRGRFPELEFYLPEEGALVAMAEVGQCSTLQVEVIMEGNQPRADVGLIVGDDSGDEDDDHDDCGGASTLVSLGSFTDFDRLLTVLPYVGQQAGSWESEIVGDAD